MNNPIITVIHDRNQPLGKRFSLNPDGTISKQSSVNVSFGIAVMHRVETHDELAALLAKVGDDPHAAIINASFNGIDVGEEFLILSEREIETRLGISRSDREKQKGIHQVALEGKSYKAIGRFKENVRASSWQILDRDIDSHTPAEFANLSTEDWLLAVGKILPGLDKVSHVKAESTSARVFHDGKSVGGGNGHIWIKVANPEDIERARPALIVCAAQVGMTWKRPRFSKSEEGKVVGYSLTTILDPSVWSPERLVFYGQPTVCAGLTVKPLVAIVHEGESDALATEAMVLPDAKAIREITRKAGVEMSVTTGSNGLRIVANDLTLATEVETKDHGILTVREIIERGITGKLRCQTPFRDSGSWAAFFNKNADGVPFVYDVGTGTTHWLNQFEAEEVKVIPASAVVIKLVPKVKEDSAAVLEDDAVQALATIKQFKPAEYQRNRAQLKQANPKVSLAAIDSAVKSWGLEANPAPTHHGFASCLLVEMTEGDWKPVGHHGSLFVADLDTGIWVRQQGAALVRMVAELYDGPETCKRSSDYRAIVEHAISLASDDTFFADAPVGIACQGDFYQIVGEGVTKVKLRPEHRQRVMLNFKPAKMPTPQFDAFLRETFESERPGEAEQQICLVQEISGAFMLGLMPRFQKAVMYYDKYGRAGKGTLERCQRGLVPAEFVTAVSPFSWGKEYFVAALAGSRLNVVGELQENESIPAAMFKTVLGGDLITGRHPTHRPITFSNEAGHLFMSNHFINTRDHTEAFFARWMIVEFPNSRLRTGLPLDPMLASRIIESEMPGIAYWALEGATRLMQNGNFSKSAVHERLMAEWRRGSSSLEEFIHECCDLSQDGKYKRSDLYGDYVQWCSGNGRKPFAKGRVKDLLEHNVGMGIRLAEVNGHETFRGLQKKSPRPKAPTPMVSTDPLIDTDDDF